MPDTGAFLDHETRRAPARHAPRACSSTPGTRSALRRAMMAADTGLPVVFHLHGRKDRTGVVAALLLLWLGVDREPCSTTSNSTNQSDQRRARRRDVQADARPRTAPRRRPDAQLVAKSMAVALDQLGRPVTAGSSVTSATSPVERGNLDPPAPAPLNHHVVASSCDVPGTSLRQVQGIARCGSPAYSTSGETVSYRDEVDLVGSMRMPPLMYGLRLCRYAAASQRQGLVQGLAHVRRTRTATRSPPRPARSPPIVPRCTSSTITPTARASP